MRVGMLRAVREAWGQGHPLVLIQHPAALQLFQPAVAGRPLCLALRLLLLRQRQFGRSKASESDVDSLSDGVPRLADTPSKASGKKVEATLVAKTKPMCS